MALTFFQDTFTNVDQALADYVVDSSTQLINTLGVSSHGAIGGGAIEYKEPE